MGLRQELFEEPISALKFRELIRITPRTTVRESITKMRAASLGCCVVVDDHARPIGMFNEKMLMKLMTLQPQALDDRVETFMTRRMAVMYPDEPIAKLINILQQKKLRWVCVCDRQTDEPIAITGPKGVMEYVVDHFPRQVLVQSMTSKMHVDEREGA